MDPAQKKQEDAVGELSIEHKKVVFDEIPEAEVRKELLGEEEAEPAEGITSEEGLVASGEVEPVEPVESVVETTEPVAAEVEPTEAVSPVAESEAMEIGTTEAVAPATAETAEAAASMIAAPGAEASEAVSAAATGFSDLGVVKSVEATNFPGQTNEAGQAEQVNQMSPVDRVEQTSQAGQAGYKSQVDQTGQMGQVDLMERINRTSYINQGNMVGQMAQASPASQSGQASQLNSANQMGQANSMNQAGQLGQMNSMNQMSSLGYANQVNPMGQAGQMNQMNQMSQMSSMGQAGFSGPVSSGTGDIILGEPEPENNSKMKIIIGAAIAIAVVFLIGMGAILAVNQGAENKKKEEVASLQQTLEGGTENFQNMVNLVSGAYEGEIVLNDFILNQEQYDQVKKMINQGIEEMHTLEKVLQENEELANGGTNEGLMEDFRGLKQLVEENKDAYEKTADFSLAIVETLRDKSMTTTKLKSYNVPELEQVIEQYFVVYREICQNNSGSESCDPALGLSPVESEAFSNAEIVQNAYMRVGGEIQQIGEFSTLYYLNNLIFEAKR